MKALACLFFTMIVITSACGGGAAHGTSGATQASSGAGGATQASSGPGGATQASSGPGGATQASSGAGGAGSTDAACDAYATAVLASPCPPAQATHAALVAQCLAGLGGGVSVYCGPQFATYFGCLGAGGLVCMNGIAGVGPKCVADNIAFVTCTATIPCESYCARATQEGCDPSSCVAACHAEEQTVGNCSSDYDQLLDCWAKKLVCSGGMPSVTGCEPEVGTVGECLEQPDTCTGYCFAAGLLGCGAGCQADCTAKVADLTCGSDYRAILHCAVGLDTLDLACTGGVPTPGASCDTEVQAYQGCTM